MVHEKLFLGLLSVIGLSRDFPPFWKMVRTSEVYVEHICVPNGLWTRMD